MKDIKNYKAKKYSSDKADFKKMEEGIYEFKGDGSKLYVTSLSFVQEPEYGEGNTSQDISQYPLEDILDKFYCHVSDFYEDINDEDSKTCYLEFASNDVEDIRNLRGIIGKHVYNSTVREDGKEIEKLIIE